MRSREFTLLRLRAWLPAGPVAGGGVREQALVQFIATNGGMRTVAASDLKVLG